MDYFPDMWSQYGLNQGGGSAIDWNAFGSGGQQPGLMSRMSSWLGDPRNQQMLLAAGKAIGGPGSTGERIADNFSPIVKGQVTEGYLSKLAANPNVSGVSTNPDGSTRYTFTSEADKAKARSVDNEALAMNQQMTAGGYQQLAQQPVSAYLGNNSPFVSGSSQPQTAPQIDRVGAVLQALHRGESTGFGDTSIQGARGNYQFMPKTWDLWSRRYAMATGGTPQAMPFTPENEEAVARFKVKTLLGEGYSPQQVALIWFTGKPEFTGAKDALGTTDTEYVARFNRNLARVGGAGASAPMTNSNTGYSTPPPQMVQPTAVGPVSAPPRTPPLPLYAALGNAPVGSARGLSPEEILAVNATARANTQLPYQTYGELMNAQNTASVTDARDLETAIKRKQGLVQVNISGAPVWLTPHEFATYNAAQQNYGIAKQNADTHAMAAAAAAMQGTEANAIARMNAETNKDLKELQRRILDQNQTEFAKVPETIDLGDGIQVNKWIAKALPSLIPGVASMEREKKEAFARRLNAASAKYQEILLKLKADYTFAARNPNTTPEEVAANEIAKLYPDVASIGEGGTINIHAGPQGAPTIPTLPVSGALGGGSAWKPPQGYTVFKTLPNGKVVYRNASKAGTNQEYTWEP